MSKSGPDKTKPREVSIEERSSGSLPVKVVVDSKGNPWICDCQVDPSKDLAAQGCWQLKEGGATRSNKRNPGQKRRRTS